MMQDGKHQGQEGHVYTNEYIGLGYVGCAHSQSPVLKKTVTDASGRYTIILNGSVYNAIELRNELQAIGYTFASQTNDIEVVLNGYIAWGEMVLDRINGMFVMAIYDNEKENLFTLTCAFGYPLHIRGAKCRPKRLRNRYGLCKSRRKERCK
jgi:asparagine synthase (glutamine-hydrolysing)